MASELETSIRNAALKLAKALEDASEITVETYYVEVGADAANLGDGKLAARSVIALDGDSKIVIPLRTAGAGELTIDTEILDLHQKNVTTAIEYRARVLNALLGLLPQRGA